MQGALDPVAQPEAALLRVLVAALLGGLIGVERERDETDRPREHFAGVRTFPIIAALGAALGLIAGGVGPAVVAGFLGVAALVAVSYAHSSRAGDVGATTEVAALATYWIGTMAGLGAFLLAGALGIGLTALLAAKQRLEAFPRALTPAELEATLTLAVITVVVWPLLPDARYGPWGVWNPRALWALVVLVCGLSFAAFVAMRFWGASRGLYVSGLLGGLVSSTAATVSFATRSRETPAQGGALAVAAGLASLVMLGRVVVLAGVAGPAVLPHLGPFAGAAALGGVVALAALARSPAPTGEAAPALANPFRLREAIRFAVLYGVVLVLVEAAGRFLGTWGVLAAAVVAGFTDVDAITLSLAALAGRELAPETAGLAIALATLSNTAAKAAYAAWLGRGRFRRGVAVALGSAFTSGTAALLLF
ncbi:MAG TPA: MgtC/SapB family protein [Gemmatimonadales bacterium]|nr:MgtC/SapB family protein [Gemmatimonadales bacterium]